MLAATTLKLAGMTHREVKQELALNVIECSSRCATARECVACKSLTWSDQQAGDWQCLAHRMLSARHSTTPAK